MAYLQLGALGLDWNQEIMGIPSWTGITKQIMAPKLAKEARRDRAQQATIQAAEAQRAAEQHALEQRQDALRFKLDQLQSGSRAATAVINEIRDAALRPELSPRPDLQQQVLTELKQWESAVLEVQGAGAGSLGSTDMTELSQAIGDVQAALGVINAVQVRAQLTMTRLREAVEELERQRQQAEVLRQRQEALKRQEERALQFLREEQVEEERLARMRADLDAQRASLSQQASIQEQIENERRLLEQSRARLVMLKRQLGLTSGLPV